MRAYKDSNGTWRIDRVPLVATGIEYELSTGPHTFTESELVDAVRATRDLAIKDPRIKLGHSSAYNDALVEDAEPAFGRTENLQLAANKQVIFGDYIGLPGWLAKVLPVAYPSRSVEAAFDVETVTGNKYAMVITDVASLGVRWPGCSVLPDLPIWYGDEMPAGLEIDVMEPIAASAALPENIKASVDVSRIRRKFYKEGPGKQNKTWWIRGEKYDSLSGLNLIVGDGLEASLFRLPVNVSGDQVEFGDPVPIENVSHPEGALVLMAAFEPNMVVHASRADTDRPESTTQEGAGMDEATRRSLAQRLGLSDDATEDQINQALDARLPATPSGQDPTAGQQGAANQEPPPAADEVGTTGPKPENPPAGMPTAAGPAVETPPSSKDNDDDANASGIVHLDKAAYDELKAGAALAVQHQKERDADRIEATVKAAISDGKIPPARRDHWKKLLSADFEGAKATLDSLEAGLVPVTERGAAGSSEAALSGNEGDGGLPPTWFPEITTIRQRSLMGAPVLQAKEG